jgi:hypothetical protein
VWLKEEGACIVRMERGPKNKTKQKKSETCLHVFTKMYLQADSYNTVYNSPKLNKDQEKWFRDGGV